MLNKVLGKAFLSGFQDLADVRASDLNGDGHADILAVGDPNEARVLLGDGAGRFSAPVESPTGAQFVNSPALADFDGDGVLDLALNRDINGMITMRGVGDGSFEAPIQLSEPITRSGDIEAGDFDGDGDADLLFVDVNQEWIWLVRGNGDFTFDVDLPTTVPRAGPFDGIAEIELADFDGDGIPDVLGTLDARCFWLENRLGDS